MSTDPQAASAEQIRAKHRSFLWPAVANYYAEPVVLAEGKGCRLRDVDGREYLDFFGGILTVGLGHGHPKVDAAVRAQLSRLVHVSSLYPTLPVVELAERLAQITPGELQKSYFVASGTEADETAVTLAQVHTGALEIIALRHGYSGRSVLAQSLTGHASWRAVPSQVAAIKHAPAPYCYRCPLGLEYPGCDVRCADDLEELIQTTTTGRIAGFLAEPILGVGGFVTPPEEYFQKAVEIVRRHGGLFLCDEVQTGFGRTGKLFGIEHYGVTPDIMTMAKAIANGLPLGVCIATPDIADSFAKLTISTFGGNPVSCAAANATLEAFEEEQVVANCATRGAQLREGLDELARKHARRIGEVRGKGLMIGVEIVVDEAAGDRSPNPAGTNAIMETAKERGLLVGKGGHFGNVLRIAPALIVSEGEIAEALEILDAAFAAAEN